MIVVDASIVAKWLWREPGAEQARALLQQRTRLVAPSLVHLEVTDAALRRFRMKELTEAEARDAIALLERFLATGALGVIPIDDLFNMAVGIAFEARHPLADCLYVAAGRHLNAPLFTADRVLHKRCKTVFPNIELLSATL